MKDIPQQTKQLKIHVGLLTLLVLLSVALNMFQLLRVKRFGEINNERINIVEKDGSLRMAISNSGRQDPGTYGPRQKSGSQGAAGRDDFF